jgi:hypothetical protein
LFVNRSSHSRPRALLAAAAALLALAVAPCSAGDLLSSPPGSDSPGFEPFSLWSIVPSSGARLETHASLSPGQEFAFSSFPTSRTYGLYGANEFGPGALRLDNTVGLDQTRATYRYTWLSVRDVDLKVGLTSNLSQFSSALRSGFSSPLRFGNLPLMHLSGVGRLAENWHVGLDANGLWTARGRSLDLGLHIDYSLTPRMQLFGGYQLSDVAGEAEDYYGNNNATINTANFGLRYRF